MSVCVLIRKIEFNQEFLTPSPSLGWVFFLFSKFTLTNVRVKKITPGFPGQYSGLLLQTCFQFRFKYLHLERYFVCQTLQLFRAEGRKVFTYECPVFLELPELG